MTRRTLLVPLFAAACILAPAKLAGRVASPGSASYPSVNSALTCVDWDIRPQQARSANRFTSEADRSS